MIKASQARNVGRKMIRENKRLLIGSYFAYFGITVLLSMISALLDDDYTVLWSLGVTFVSTPLMLGVLHVYNMVYYKRACSISNMFDFFSQYRVSLKAIGLTFICVVVTTAVMVPVIFMVLAPSLGFIGFTGGNSIGPSLLGMALLLIAVTALVGIAVSSLSMAGYYIALRNRSIAFGRLLGDALKIGWKHLPQYMAFQLSFLGWSLLAILPAFGVLLAVAFALASSPAALYHFYSGGYGSFGILTLAPLLLAAAALSFVAIYNWASSAAFWNTAIDQYELDHPDYGAYTPNVPQTPAGGFGQDTGGPVRFGDFRVGEPDDAASAPETGAPPETGAETADGAGKPVFDVVLTGAGVTRMTVGRVISEVTPFGLAEAQALIDSAPVTIREGLTREEAQEIAKLLTDAGATVEIR